MSLLDKLRRSARFALPYVCWPATSLAGLAAPALAQSAGPAAPAPRAATVIVLDGSNSMNARLPGDKSFKFVSVRDALRASLPRIAGTEVGLATFGARRASDCNDAEVAAPPSRDQAGVMSALDRFQPRGFSPVVLALRTAAKALPQGVDKASIVLVLDDLASCRGEDPCAVAGALKRDNPALAIHIVTLGPRPVDLPVFACIVRQTGGQLFQVADGPGIAPAIEEALAVAGQPAPPAPSPAVAASPADRPRSEARVAAKPDPAKVALGIDPTQPGLHLTARLVDGAPALLVPTEWRIWNAEPSADETADKAVGPGERRAARPLVEVTAPALTRRLPNGRYVIEAKAGLVSVRRTIEISQQGPTPVAIDLDAALLAISAPLARGGPAAPTTAIEVRSEGTATAPLWIARGGARDLVVPPGSYRVVARDGLASAERVLSLGPGVTGQVDLALEAGRLVVEEQTPTAQGGSRVHMLLETDDADNARGRRELFRAATSRLDLALPAGSYLLTVQRDAAETRDRIQIRPGDVVRRAGMLPAARVRLDGRIAQGLPRGIPITYRVERLDSPSRPLVQWTAADASLELVPGRYRLQARLGEQNATAAREVEVRASPSEQRIELDIAAAAVQLRLGSANAGLGFGEVYWQIHSDEGEPIWRTGEREPLVALRAGRYRIQAETRERRLEQTIEVRHGDNRVVELGG